MGPSETRAQRYKQKQEDKLVVHAFRVTFVDNTAEGARLRSSLRAQCPHLGNVFNQLEEGFGMRAKSWRQDLDKQATLEAYLRARADGARELAERIRVANTVPGEFDLTEEFNTIDKTLGEDAL